MKNILLVALLAGLPASQIIAQDVEMNRKHIREVFTALEKKDYAKFASNLSENAIDYAAGPEPARGREACVAAVKSIFDALSDVHITIDDIGVSGNKYYVKNTLKAKHTGNLFGMIPPTGKPIAWSDVDILELDKDGKCVAHWANNPNALFEQIGYLAFANPNTSLVMQGYAKFGKGDFGGIADACTDDVVWDVTDNPDAKTARVYNGKKELGMFFKNLSTALQITKFEPVRFFADGDDVIAFINTEYKMTGNPKLYRTTLVHHFVLKNGKIASFKEIVDKLQEIAVATK
ncbi:nuclear transport factor 2 family protein [Runella sp.]|uniref:nuclear transport factor 2 family protein n=1 Tax=Runella sp. TaxID=1960881 RepID=UPI003D0C9D95